MEGLYRLEPEGLVLKVMTFLEKHT